MITVGVHAVAFASALAMSGLGDIAGPALVFCGFLMALAKWAVDQ